MNLPDSFTVGSLCSGYGGLELAIGGDLRWVAEVDPHACTVLEHRFPHARQLGDLTLVDWSTVEPVDVMAFGFPCQDLSYAGRGSGITEGTRSGLFFDCWRAVRALRPRLVFVENVAAILTRRPGFDVVAAEVAASGYDLRWVCVRACDVGAPHRRDRWFGLAVDAAPVTVGDRVDPDRRVRRRVPSGGPGPRGPALPPGPEVARPADVVPDGPDAAPDPDRGRLPSGRVGTGLDRPRIPRHDPVGRGATGPADREPWPEFCRDCGHEEWRHDAGGFCQGCGDRCPEHANPDPDGWGYTGPGPAEFLTRPDAPDADVAGSQGPESKGRRLVPPGRGEPAPDSDGVARATPGLVRGQAGKVDEPGEVERAVGLYGVAPEPGHNFGPFADAVERWAAIIGRPAPAPVDNAGRLAPRFVEWMMGLPDGWVCDVPQPPPQPRLFDLDEPELPRTGQLRCLGNGVVPQQARAAWEILTDPDHPTPERPNP